jgi:hypothetical protein
MTTGRTFLDAFEAAAAAARAAEAQSRQEAVRRTAMLETERAFAFRRLNLLKAMAGATGQSESEEAAVATGLAALRHRLDWSTVDEARNETLARFSPVLTAIFHATREQETPPDMAEARDPAPVADTLAEFEAWYRDNRPSSFWALFEQELPVLPLVEV